MATSPIDTPRFTRLELENWRNFLHVNVGLERRVFIVGPNASGKSNLLDALRFLRDIASIGGGLQDAVVRRGGVSSIRALAARGTRSDIGLLVTVGARQELDLWEYELRIGQTGGRPHVRKELVRRDGQAVLTRPDVEDEADPERLTQTALEQVNLNRDFRELAEFFSSIRYLHIVPQLIREPERSVGKRNDPFGGDFLERVATTQKKSREARLRQILKAAQVAVPQLEELKLEADIQGAWHLKGKYRHWRPQGAWQTEQDLSDGTLRLFGLLWAVLERGGPLLLEEPELSLHPEVVRRVPQILARALKRTGGQIVISTHSVELLRDEGIGLDEVLLLEPQQEGTSVRSAGDFQEVRALLEGGLTLADAVVPRTRPRDVEQLALFPS